MESLQEIQNRASMMLLWLCILTGRQERGGGGGRGSGRGEWEGLEDTFSSWDQGPGIRVIFSFPNWEGTHKPAQRTKKPHAQLPKCGLEGSRQFLTNYGLAWVDSTGQNLGCQTPHNPNSGSDPASPQQLIKCGGKS